MSGAYRQGMPGALPTRDGKSASLWPHAREVVARGLRGVPEDELQKIVWENAARRYGFHLA